MSKFEDFPSLLSSNDLVKLGLYKSVASVYLARLRGHSPDYIKVGRKVLYPKSEVLAFMEKSLQSGSVGKEQAVQNAASAVQDQTKTL